MAERESAILASEKVCQKCGVSALFTDLKDGPRLEQADDVWERTNVDLILLVS